MSWRYPKGHTRPDEVVAIDGLNDGFLPVVEECQGRLNEQNFKEGAVRRVNFAAPFAADGYVPTTHVEDDVWEVVRTAGLVVVGFTPMTTGACLTPAYNGVNDYLSWVSGNFKEATIAGWIGGWSPPNADLWTVVGSDTIDQSVFPGADPHPLRYETTLDESTTIWVMCSLQGVSIDYSGRGIQFAVFINGAMITETMWGSGDESNTRAGQRVSSPAGEAAASFFAARGAGTYTPFEGYPVCVETIQPVPPGRLTVEIKCNVRGLPAKHAIGSRELIILFLGR